MSVPFPPNIWSNTEAIDALFYRALVLTGVPFVLILLALIYFLVRYRAREGHKAYYTQGNSKQALFVTLALAVVVFFGIDVQLAYYDYHAYESVFGGNEKTSDELEVRVLAKQFEWNFRYPGPDGEFGGEDDIFTNGRLVIPVDRDVRLRLRSIDVLHSFFLPNMRIKQDVVPGLTVDMRIHSEKTTEQVRTLTGDSKYELEVVCAELCGLQHTKMRATLLVLPIDEYKKWVVAESKSSQARGGLDVLPEPVFDGWEAWPPELPKIPQPLPAEKRPETE